MRVEFPCDVGELARLFERVVHVFDENKFERNHPPVFFRKFLCGGNELCERELAVDGHDLRAHFVGRAMQADCEAKLHRLVGEFANFRHDAARGNCDAPRAHAQAPRRVRDGERAHRCLVIHERFAHAHDNDVVKIRKSGFPRAFIAAFPTNEHELRHDFARVEIAFPTRQAACAKFASLGTTDLRRNANGFAGTLFARAFLRSAKNHAFDECAVAHLEQEFLRNVARLGAFRDEFRRHKIISFRQPRARSRRNIRHFFERAHAFFVNPFENLRGSKRLFSARLQCGGERFFGFGKNQRARFGHLLPEKILCENAFLDFGNFGNAFFSESNHRGKFIRRKCRFFAGRLKLDKPPRSRHYDVCVHGGIFVFQIAQIKNRCFLIHSDADGGDGIRERIFGEFACFDEFFDGELSGNIGAGNGGGARAAVRLKHVAIDPKRHAVEFFKIDNGAECAPDEALNFDGAPVEFAAGNIAGFAVERRIRQERIFCGEPAAFHALDTHPRRHFFFERCRANNARVAEACEHGAGGVRSDAGLKGNRAELIRFTVVGSDNHKWNWE